MRTGDLQMTIHKIEVQIYSTGTLQPKKDNCYRHRFGGKGKESLLIAVPGEFHSRSC
jgi:hypothetical protein